MVEHLRRAAAGQPGSPGQAPGVLYYLSVNSCGLAFELYVVGQRLGIAHNYLDSF